MPQLTLKGSNIRQLRLYVFLSALAVNVFLEVITITNWLSIRYFFYTIPMTIQIDFISPPGNTLLWIGSLYFFYITKDVAEDYRKSQQFNNFLRMALVGSFFLIFSVLLQMINTEADITLKTLLNLLWFLSMTVGYVLSFVGAALAGFSLMALNRNLRCLFLIYFFSLLIPIEIWSLVHWLAYPFDIVSNSGFAWKGAFLELQLFYLTYPLIFWLFIAFLFSWIWVPLAKFAATKIVITRHTSEPSAPDPKSGTEVSQTVRTEGVPNHKTETHRISSTRCQLVPVAVMLVSLCLGAFIAYYPYINPEPGLVGTDTLGYYYSLTAMADKGFFEAVQLAAKINNARILYHMSLYVIQNLTRLPSNTIIELIPVVTMLANALATFWFVKIGEKNAVLAAMIAFFSIFSFNTVIGIHAGLFANWLAMAFGFAMLGLVLKFQEKKKLKLLLATVLASALVFLIHYWSFVFFLAVLGCYGFLTWLERRARDTKPLVLAVIIASAVVITLLLSSLISRFFISYGPEQNMWSTDVFALFLNKLPILIDTWFFGTLANPIIMILALVGIAECFYRRTNFSRLLIAWTAAGSILSVAVSPVGTSMNLWLVWRTLYLIPFQIPAALGLFFLLGKLKPARQNNKLHDQNYGQAQSFPTSPKNQTLKAILLLVSDYAVSAVLLTIDFPVFTALILVNYSILCVILHYRIVKGDIKSTLIWIIVLFTSLVLLNYTLRLLAPLTVNRMRYW